MTHSKKFAGLVVATALTSACTSNLESTKLNTSGDRAGIGYVLPFTQYAMSVTWRLDYCPADATVDDKAARIVVKTEATRGTADDAELAFMIDPGQLQTPTSVTAFGAKWIDGTNQLSSINASVEDRTAQIIGNLTKTAISAIKLFGGPGAAAGNAYLPCSDSAKTALAKAKTAKADLDIKTEDVEAATEELTTVKQLVDALGTSIDKLTKKRYADAITALTKAKESQNVATEALAKAQKAISFTRKFYWPADGKTFSSNEYKIDGATLTGWIPGGRAPSIFLQIDRLGSFGQDPRFPGAGAPSASLKGLRYRMPAKGQLLVCTRSKCGLDDAPVDSPAHLDHNSILASFEGPVAQLGYVNVLKFRGRAFGTNSFTADFNPDSSLKAVEFEQKAAPLEQATGALADTASQLATALDPTAKLKEKTDYLKALKDQRDAQAALVPAAADPNAQSMSTLNSETSLLKAQITNLEAQIALDALRAKLPQ
jgi:hypothetical protein